MLLIYIFFLLSAQPKSLEDYNQKLEDALSKLGEVGELSEADLKEVRGEIRHLEERLHFWTEVRPASGGWQSVSDLDPDLFASWIRIRNADPDPNGKISTKIIESARVFIKSQSQFLKITGNILYSLVLKEPGSWIRIQILIGPGFIVKVYAGSGST